MRKAFLTLAVLCALGMIAACKNTNNTKAEEDTTLFADTVQPTDTVFVEKTVEETVVWDTFLPQYFDFLPREDYLLLIKDVLKYDKKNGVDLDSAIRMYSDDVLPDDSIIKWWNNISISN